MTAPGSVHEGLRSERANESPAPLARRVPLRQLSRGNDGSALLARVIETGELVELRHASVAQSDPARWQAIDKAAQVYSLLTHGSFRRLAAREVADGTPVLVFRDYIDRDLTSWIATGPLAEHDAWLLCTRIAQALSAMHTLGLSHRRLGPSAVRLRDDHSPLLDFAWLDVGSPWTELDELCRPPEASRETLDTSSDVFALGMLLHVLLLGRAPTPADGGQFLSFEPLIRDCTLSEREARPSMAEVCERLDVRRPEGNRSLALQATHLSIPANANASPGALARAAPEQDAALAPQRRLVPGATLGRFELLRKIGEGGMGEVFEAIDRATGEHAALKVLRADAMLDPARVKRFRKEARILSEIRSPHVANLIEWNRDAGVDFIALEYVAGGDLAQWLDQQGGRIHETDALAILADVSRGLVEAHMRGIVHRDIKPQNVMIEGFGDWQTDGQMRLKLCDFGIARALEGRSGTLAFTEHDKVLGTPDFMAPEQAGAGLLTPAADVYALGVMAFLLIAGRLPFETNDLVAMMVAHAVRPPPPLASVAPDVSEATAALVDRMLRKAPEERFADASLLLEAIERILRGDPTPADVHPVRPSAPADKVVCHVFEWDLKSSAAALWPFVSNTDRLNRAVGLPPAAFERVTNALGVETFASNRVAGVNLRWREHPFEWVEGRRWGVLRAFEAGVMRWYTIELELIPKPEGGTRLRYSMTLEPRHWFGKWIVALEVRWKQRPALGRVFARIDAHASATGALSPGDDAFEPPPPLGSAQQAALQRGLAKLALDGARPELLDALGSFCTHAPDQEVAHLRPLAFARVNGLDSDAVVDACLRGAHHGLFVLLWEVLCPLCRIPSDFAESLRALADHGRCPSCNVDFPLDFTQSLELVFRVAADVRSSELRTFCIGGPAFAPHVVAQMRLPPAERLSLELALGHGSYKIRSPQLPYAIPVQVSSVGRTHRGSVRFSAEVPHSDSRVLLAAGVQSIQVENTLDREIVMRLERTAPREDALTAARAACLPSFRKLFPGEVLASGRLVAVGRTAFLVAHIQAQRQLMSELGDARAFELMLKHLAWIEEAVAGEGGAVVKTASAGTLCAFDSASAAARAALALRLRLNDASRDASERGLLDLRIAVHQGPAVAATVDGRLDYFGHTVETAYDLIAFTTANQVLLSAALAEDPNTTADLTAASHALELVQLGGAFGNALQVTPA